MQKPQSNGRPENSSPAADAGVAHYKRPRELQDGLNFHLYHPLSRRLALWLKPTWVTPNALSVSGGLLVVLAAIFYWIDAWPVTVIAALLLHMSWHILDGADGDLARLRGTSSRTGELIDGICDYAGHGVLYFALGIVLSEQFGAGIWALTFAAVGSRILQANFYETLRRQYQYWVYDVPWLGAGAQDSAGAQDGAGDGHALNGFASAYLKLGSVLVPSAKRIDDYFERAKAEQAQSPSGGDDAWALSARAIVKTEIAGLLRGLTMLGANYRTIILGVSMLAGSPLYFFIFEAVILNICLVWSLLKYRSAERRSVMQLDQLSAKSFR